MIPRNTILVQVDAELEDLIPRFLANQHKALAGMLEALQLQDYEAIRHIAHRVKGVAGGYGFDAATEMSDGIEQAARAGQHAEIASGLASLVDYFERVEVVYHA